MHYKNFVFTMLAVICKFLADEFASKLLHCSLHSFPAALVLFSNCRAMLESEARHNAARYLPGCQGIRCSRTLLQQKSCLFAQSAAVARTALLEIAQLELALESGV